MMTTALRGGGAAPSSTRKRCSARSSAVSRRTVVAVQAFTSSSGRSASQMPTAPREVLREVGSVGDDTFNRVQRLHDGVLDRPRDAARLVPVLSQVMAACSLTSRDLQLILVRHAQVFGYPPEDVAEVLAFLRQDLGLEGQQLRLVLTRFPQVFSYSVKAHLRPQLAYLQSLGVPREQLRDYVVARPLLLGEGIETVIKFLRACGVPRRQMGQLLRTFPIDYCCQFIVPDSPPATASAEDQ